MNFLQRLLSRLSGDARDDAPRSEPVIAAAASGAEAYASEDPVRQATPSTTRADGAETPPAPPAGPSPAEVAALLGLLARVVRAAGRSATLADGRLVLADELELEAEYVDRADLADGSLRTVTRITARHPTAFPRGLEEFQHAAGATPEASIVAGFEAWTTLALVTLEDALRVAPDPDTLLEMHFESGAGRPARTRQVILGPVAQLRAALPATATAAPAPPRAADAGASAEAHPFCPCCLLSESLDAFAELLRSDDVLGIQLYAALDEDGREAADCRVNGAPFPAGAEALRRYARRWPRQGVEYRKQYVIVRTRPATPAH